MNKYEKTEKRIQKTTSLKPENTKQSKASEHTIAKSLH